MHVHTVLSPCGDIEMIPPLIVEAAIEKGIQLIAITDHNASANIWAVQKAAEGTGLSVLPGMELQTAEDIHCLCLFDTLEQIEMLQHDVDTNLPALENRPDFFGEQFVVDPTGDFIRREHRLLLTSTRLTLKQAFQRVLELGGLFIPAHINRQAFGLMPTLGLIPPDIDLEAVEISRHMKISDAQKKYPQITNIPTIQSGDVHYLEDFLGTTYFKIAHPTIAELRMALKNQNGRMVLIQEQ
ncbi:hypothetical protein ADN00_15485 [Ornatilinea apprima]|uniref:Polymerase/histidinol phosphatase N-terminal domain-containing protein n=1 Tax=Ornatilinea apprima TaxID=1134406 RepID=A0A0P6WT56_9CHLR|nr:hypothetical protein ADN00_15485 [Ornatilinea apprima]